MYLEKCQDLLTVCITSRLKKFSQYFGWTAGIHIYSYLYVIWRIVYTIYIDSCQKQLGQEEYSYADEQRTYDFFCYIFSFIQEES